MSRTSAIARLVALAGLATLGTAHAQTTNFLPASGNWLLVANWDNSVPGITVSGVIAPGRNVTVNGGCNTADLFLTGPGAIVSITSGETLTIHGSSVVNDGEILINPFNGGFDSQLFFSGAVCTLSGTGSIVLDPLGTQLAVDAGFQTSAPANVVVNSASHTIKGNGYIPAGFSNFGLITADNAARWLKLNTNPQANAGDIIASNGGTLYFSGCATTQTATGVIRATGARSIAYIGSGVCSLTGGIWEGINDGIASTGGAVRLDNVTTNGTVRSGAPRSPPSSTTSTPRARSPSTPPAARATLTSPSTPPQARSTGGGTIVLNPVGAASGSDAEVISNAPGNIVTNAAGNTIRGNVYDAKAAEWRAKLPAAAAPKPRRPKHGYKHASQPHRPTLSSASHRLTLCE
jgi:hypothetical protein